MKAITIYQPYASLVAIGAKLYETRGWKTNYRGPIAVHAGAKPVFPWFQHEAEKETRLAIIGALADSGQGLLQHLPLGAVIATAELVDCQEIEMKCGDNRPFVRKAPLESRRINGQIVIHRSPVLTGAPEREITGNEFLFGDWTPGRYAWELSNVQMLPEPIPAKGKQGFWNWEEQNNKARPEDAPAAISSS